MWVVVAWVGCRVWCGGVGSSGMGGVCGVELVVWCSDVVVWCDECVLHCTNTAFTPPPPRLPPTPLRLL